MDGQQVARRAAVMTVREALDATRPAPLTFVYVEPYVVPKRSPAGDARERADMRFLQLNCELEPATLAAFVGERVDVFIGAES